MEEEAATGPHKAGCISVKVAGVGSVSRARPEAPPGSLSDLCALKPHTSLGVEQSLRRRATPQLQPGSGLPHRVLRGQCWWVSRAPCAAGSCKDTGRHFRQLPAPVGGWAAVSDQGAHQRPSWRICSYRRELAVCEQERCHKKWGTPPCHATLGLPRTYAWLL